MKDKEKFYIIRDGNKNRFRIAKNDCTISDLSKIYEEKKQRELKYLEQNAELVKELKKFNAIRSNEIVDTIKKQISRLYFAVIFILVLLIIYVYFIA